MPGSNVADVVTAELHCLLQVAFCDQKCQKMAYTVHKHQCDKKLDQQLWAIAQVRTLRVQRHFPAAQSCMLLHSLLCLVQKTCMSHPFVLCQVDHVLQSKLQEAVAVAGNSASPPYPPSLAEMITSSKKAFAERNGKLLVACASYSVARYFMHHGDLKQVSTAARVPCLPARQG